MLHHLFTEAGSPNQTQSWSTSLCPFDFYNHKVQVRGRTAYKGHMEQTSFLNGYCMLDFPCKLPGAICLHPLPLKYKDMKTNALIMDYCFLWALRTTEVQMEFTLKRTKVSDQQYGQISCFAEEGKPGDLCPISVVV